MHTADSIYKGFAAQLAGRGYATIAVDVGQHEAREDGRLLMGERVWHLGGPLIGLFLNHRVMRLVSAAPVCPWEGRWPCGSARWTGASPPNAVPVF